MVNMVPVARKSTPQPLKVLNPLVIRKVKNEPALPSPEWSIAGTQSVSDKEENGKVGQKGKGVEYEFYEECESYEKGEKYEDDEEDTAEKQDDTEEEEEENEKEKEKEKEKEEEMKKMDLPTFLRSLEERTFVDAPTATGLTTLRYEYEPLSDSKEAFRLLRLLPGPRTDPIQCDLCIEQIEGSPSYEAISYTWGDPNDTAEVLCNGRLLKVTKSLLGALQRFRHQEAPRTVWADAVCIDQGNLLERGHQVSIMGRIYSRATKVLIWLGKPADMEGQIIADLVNSFTLEVKTSAISSTSKSKTFFTSNSEASETVETPEVHKKLVKFLETVPPLGWNNLKAILKNSWFSRIWILQEVGLARDASLFCGSAVISWSGFCQLCEAVFQNSFTINRLIGRPIVAPYIIRNLGFKVDPGPKILSILLKGWMFNASDPKDKVFALLSHPSFERGRQVLGLDSFIPIDYESSHYETYFMLARQLLNMDKDLTILNFVTHTEETMSNTEAVISWVPRWDVDRYGMILGVKCYAAGDTTLDFSLSGRSLKTKGILIDALDWVSDLFWTRQVPQLTTAWGEFLNSCSGSRFVSIIRLFQTFCEAIDGGIVSTKWPWPKTTTKTVMMNLLLYLQYIGGTGPYLDEEIHDLRSDGDLERFQLLSRSCLGRRFFITKQGYCGIGPEVMEPGDKVCVFFGYRAPVILKPHPTVDETYRFCGNCYIPELKDGQAIAMWKNGDIEEQNFKLL